MAPSVYSDWLSEAANVYSQNQHLLGMYLHLIVSALFPIYTGSYASLSRPSSAAKSAKEEKDNEEDDEDEEETVQKMEGLTPSDAIIFPLTAGAVLLFLYWVIKTWGASVTNTILGIYFSFIGTYSVGKLISDMWSTVVDYLMPNYYTSGGRIWKVSDAERRAVVVSGSNTDASFRTTPFGGKAGYGTAWLPTWFLNWAWAVRDFSRRKYVAKGYMQDVLDVRVVFTRHNIIASILGVAAIGYSLFIDKPWWLTNLQGFAVCYGALQLMSPTTFTTGSMILTGLFFYDIWAVFFTPLMVTVAQNLDVPIKLVFPRPEDPNFPSEGDAKPSYSMLGLGDIVLPGLMIALALRFDLYLFYLRKQKSIQTTKSETEQAITSATIEKAPYVSTSGDWAGTYVTSLRSNTPPSGSPPRLSGSFPKPYFHSSLVGYIFGMLATLVCMTVFKHAQPALLYLVPGVLISIWGTALARGEAKLMWGFTEAEDVEDNQDEDGKQERKEKGEIKDLEETGSWLSNLWKSFSADKEKKIADIKDVIARPTGIAEDVLFSFTITSHSPKSGSKSDAGTESGASTKTTRSKSLSPSTGDDAVLVGSADL